MSAHAYLSLVELRRALAIRDLTDPAQGPHAMQVLLDAIHAALPVPVRVHRSSPIVPVADNYDRLRYPPDGAARDARYSRYVCDGALLRTQTSALIPPLLESTLPDDIILSCPGIVYRRDAIDRLHVGEPHQVDLWRIATRPLGHADLLAMIDNVVGAALPGVAWRTEPAEHPYTTGGLQIDARIGDDWVEIGECGIAAIVAPRAGLAMGLGLDRLLMIRKGIADIRVLRASEPRIASQMLDLSPYREVSAMPPVQRDISVCLDDALDTEAIGDVVRGALGDRAGLVEMVEVRTMTPCEQLTPAANARLGSKPGQVNALVRVTLRALDRTLTHTECNELRDAIYVALHRGSVQQLASIRTS